MEYTPKIISVIVTEKQTNIESDNIVSLKDNTINISNENSQTGEITIETEDLNKHLNQNSINFLKELQKNYSINLEFLHSSAPYHKSQTNLHTYCLNLRFHYKSINNQSDIVLIVIPNYLGEEKKITLDEFNKELEKLKFNINCPIAIIGDTKEKCIFIPKENQSLRPTVLNISEISEIFTLFIKSL